MKKREHLMSHSYTFLSIIEYFREPFMYIENTEKNIFDRYYIMTISSFISIYV